MKKVLSLVLALTLVLGMSSMAFAKITGTNTKFIKGDLYLGYSQGGTAPWVEESQYLDTCTPGAYKGPENVKLYILTETGDNYIGRTDVSKTKLTAAARKTSGGAVLRDVSIQYDSDGYAYVRVRFIEYHVSTSDVDFDYTVYLQYNKSKDNGTEFGISGTISNPKQEVEEGDDYVDVSETPQVKALDYIKKIEVYLGDGVSIMARMFQDKKYYGRVSQEIKEADVEITDQYPDIDTVFYLYTVGLNNSGDIVKFDLASNMWVYVQDDNGDLVYLGRSNSLLPYYSKYFVAGKELNIAASVQEPDDTSDVDDIPVDVPSDSDTGNASTGGDDVITNVNDNPGTGR